MSERPMSALFGCPAVAVAQPMIFAPAEVKAIENCFTGGQIQAIDKIGRATIDNLNVNQSLSV